MGGEMMNVSSIQSTSSRANREIILITIVGYSVQLQHAKSQRHYFVWEPQQSEQAHLLHPNSDLKNEYQE